MLVCKLECFSYVTKYYIFKNLNLNRKVDCNFGDKLWKNHFRFMEYSNPQSWLARSCYHVGTFQELKSWSSHLWQSHSSRVYLREFTTKENLLTNFQKKIIILNLLRLWLTKKPKIWAIFYEEVFIKGAFVVLKLPIFGFNISFSLYACCINAITHLLLLVCGI